MSKENVRGEWRVASDDNPSLEWPALPTETEIYILPNGEIVVADLPVELMDLITQLHLNLSSEPASPPAIG